MASEGERGAELLRADKEQLDRAATLLGGEDPGFVIVACGKELVGPALGYLRGEGGVEIPDPVVLQGSEAALEALVEIETGKVRSLSLGGEAKEALRALNWHREKLLKGAPVVLWVDGVDGLTEMREAAPDAYSFRDMVVMLRGGGGRLPTAPHKESRSILEARRRLARAKTALERATARGRLSEELRVHGYLIESESVATAGLDLLPNDKYSNEDARIARASLWACVAMAAAERHSQSRQGRAAQRGLKELDGVAPRRAQETLAWLFSIMPGPSGRDRLHAEQALVLAHGFELRVSTYVQVVRMLSATVRSQGDLKRARELLKRLDPLALPRLMTSLVAYDQGVIESISGRLLEADSCFRAAVLSRSNERATGSYIARIMAINWLDRGELDIAEKALEDSKLDDVNLGREASEHHELSLLWLSRGDMGHALEHARCRLREAAQFGLDTDHINGCSHLASVADDGYHAALIDERVLEEIVIELEIAEEVSSTITDNDPPSWHTIRYLSCRADILVLTDQRDQALTLARRALDLSRTTYPDLIPETGRALADHLLRTGNPAEALPLLAEIEPEAISRDMLKELSRIRAARVLALVLLHEPPSVIEPALTSLREALESTGAPRIKAETLQELAIRLPPASLLPDPLTLATETHTLFVEMPMPAKEARSLELAGDILAARGKPAEAKRRYLMAQGILERRGLGLRLPLLAKKIAAIA